MRKLLLFLILVSTEASCLHGQTTTAWNGYRGPKRDGMQEHEKVVPFRGKPNIAWSRNVGVGYSAITMFDGRAYTMGHAGGNDIVLCLDGKSGKILWQYPYPCKSHFHNYYGPRSTPAVNAQCVYTASGEGQLFCLDSKTGNPVWKTKASALGCRQPGWGISCSPLINGRTIIYEIGRIFALDGKTGRPLWRSSDYGSAYSSPLSLRIRNRDYIAAFPAGGLMIVDASSGRPAGSFKWKTQYDVNAAMPVVSGDKIFISSGYGRGCALIRIAGRLQRLYENSSMCNHFTTCVLHKGFLYGISGQAKGGGKLMCMHFDTGRVAWVQGGMGTGSLAIAEDKLVVLGEAGDLIIAEANSAGYKCLSHAKVLNNRCWTMPTVSDGKIFCRDEKGNVVCVDVSK